MLPNQIKATSPLNFLPLYILIPPLPTAETPLALPTENKRGTRPKFVTMNYKIHSAALSKSDLTFMSSTQIFTTCPKS